MTTTASQQQVLDRLVHFYQTFDLDAIQRLGDVYSEQVTFEDPIRRIHGLAALQAYFTSLMQHVKSCRFDVVRYETTARSGFVEWEMYFSHAALNRGDAIKVSGVTVLSFEDKITYHRDYFDLGEMLYEHVPVMGVAARHLKRRLQA